MNANTEWLQSKAPAFIDGVAMEDYLALDAISATHLDWLNVSPLHYRHMCVQPAEDTEATRRGTAVHMKLLEPGRFDVKYAQEPDPALVAPDNVKPRATKAYKDAVAFLEEDGRTVLKMDEWKRVHDMAAALHGNEHVRKLLARAPQREVTGIWDRDGRRCRARFDMLGDGVMVDLKITRSLADFNPYVITRMGYYRRLAWYCDGAERLGSPIQHAFIVAVEATAPHDVGVFIVDQVLREVGLAEARSLLTRLRECELTDTWPGMFPDIQTAQLSNQAAAALEGVTEEEGVI